MRTNKSPKKVYTHRYCDNEIEKFDTTNVATLVFLGTKLKECPHTFQV